MATTTTAATYVRNTLISIFLLAFVIGGSVFFFLQYDYALENSAVRARGLMAIAKSVRTFTSERLRPILSADPSKFHSESIPAFVIQTVYKGVKSGDIPFSYREHMLNPTSPLDRADEFDTGLIDRFRSDRSLKEISGTRPKSGGTDQYIAYPIVITDPSCLGCHGTPESAPKAVLAKFGSQNGFGWALNEPIGVQIVEVPVTGELYRTFGIFAVVFGGLAVIFAAAYLAISHALDRNLLSPLRLLAAEAERHSRSIAAPTPRPHSKLRELVELSTAFERLRLSAHVGRTGAAPAPRHETDRG